MVVVLLAAAAAVFGIVVLGTAALGAAVLGADVHDAVVFGAAVFGAGVFAAVGRVVDVAALLIDFVIVGGFVVAMTVAAEIYLVGYDKNALYIDPMEY